MWYELWKKFLWHIHLSRNNAAAVVRILSFPVHEAKTLEFPWSSTWNLNLGGGAAGSLPLHLPYAETALHGEKAHRCKAFAPLILHRWGSWWQSPHGLRMVRSQLSWWVWYEPLGRVEEEEEVVEKEGIPDFQPGWSAKPTPHLSLYAASRVSYDWHVLLAWGGGGEWWWKWENESRKAELRSLLKLQSVWIHCFKTFSTAKLRKNHNSSVKPTRELLFPSLLSNPGLERTFFRGKTLTHNSWHVWPVMYSASCIWVGSRADHVCPPDEGLGFGSVCSLTRLNEPNSELIEVWHNSAKWIRWYQNIDVQCCLGFRVLCGRRLGQQTDRRIHAYSTDSLEF